MIYIINTTGQIDKEHRIKPCAEAIHDTDFWFVRFGDLEELDNFVRKYTVHPHVDVVFHQRQLTIKVGWIGWRAEMELFGLDCFSTHMQSAYADQSEDETESGGSL